MKYKDKLKEQQEEDVKLEDELQEEDKDVKEEESAQPQTMVTDEDVKEAQDRLTKYIAAKQAIDSKATENQEWWRLRHWNDVKGRSNTTEAPESTSAWAVNSILNKHADIMDSFPKPNILPREEENEAEAKVLSEIVPSVLDRNRYKRTYDAGAYDFLIDGGAATGVFWDNSKNRGLGDISINQIDVHSLFWEPDKDDIQDSREVFIVARMKAEDVVAMYPQMDGHVGGETFTLAKYQSDSNNMDESELVDVVDWYYKVPRYEEVFDELSGMSLVKTITTLHYAKFCNGILLYASENDPTMERGFYHHGKYPIVIRRCLPIKDSPWGFGYLDIMKNPQLFIDALDEAINRGAFMCSKPRFWIKDSAGVDPDDFADWSKELVKCTGDMDLNIKPIEIPNTPAFVVQHKQNKIDELKETSGNRDFSQGSTQSGVTAASAIAALQEAGSKLARDINRTFYEGYQEEVYLVIELIRQFYTEPRSFRVDNPAGGHTFTQYQTPDPDADKDVMFDIQVVAEKQSPFSRAAQNELVKELYSMGMFDPANSVAALTCLEAMEFEGREKIMEKIQENSLVMQQMQQMQAVIMQADAVIPGLAAAAGLAPQMMPGEAAPEEEAPAPEPGPKKEGTPEDRVARNKGDDTRTANARLKASKQANI